MNFKATLVLGLILMINSFCFGQMVSGKITDAYGPLVEVEVKVAGTDYYAMTNQEGEFVLPVPAHKAVELEVNYTFYSTLKIVGLNLSEGEFKTLDVVLEVQSMEQDEVLMDLSTANTLRSDISNKN